jgi:cobalamin biosynthesis protein CobD/CbiB
MDYNKYISQLKRDRPEINYDRMFARILQRSSPKPWKPKLAVAAALAVFLVGFAAYFISGQSKQLASTDAKDPLMAYVFEENENIDGPVVDYILCGW